LRVGAAAVEGPGGADEEVDHGKRARRTSHQFDLHLAAHQGGGALQGQERHVAGRVEQTVNLRAAGLEQGRQAWLDVAAAVRVPG
jgi:hypothetical protein